MKVTIWGINYSPELTGIAPYNQMMCEHLKLAGHEPIMVTSFAYYPAWKKSKEDAGRLYRTDSVNGVKVHRCWHYVPAKVSSLKRIIHEATFVTTSFLRLLTLPAPDVYVVVSPPLLLGLAAWLLTRFRRAPFVFHVQDLQPDAALALGMLKPSTFTRMLYWLESVAYQKAAAVSGISHGMLDAFTRKGVPPARQIYFPNPAPFPDLSTLPKPGGFRARFGFSKDDFLAVYSGNLGVKQGLSILIAAARELKNSNLPVKIIICGDGAMRPQIESAINQEKLAGLYLYPLQPVEQYRELLVDADVCLITQQAGSGAAFFPSKLLATLGFGRPVISVADDASELSRAIKVGHFGENVQPGDAQRLAEVLRKWASNKTALEQFGKAGREYVAQFESGRVLTQFTADLQRVAQVK